MAALATNIDPFKHFKGNDVFTSLNDPDKRNPYAGVASASKEEIKACGRYGPFEGPFFILGQDQHEEVLDAFNE